MARPPPTPTLQPTRFPYPTLFRSDSASRHAETGGFGFQDLIKENHRWVLARLAVEMNRYPKVDEDIAVETWVENINKIFTSRNFKITDSENNVIGYSRSIWSVINFDTRQVADLSTYKGIGEYLLDQDCPIDAPSKIGKVNDEEPEIYRVRVSDLDVNRHLTSAKYIDHLLDRFSLETFDKKRVKRFEIQYINEVMYDEKISILKEEVSEDNYTLEIKNEAGETCSKSRCVFITI